MYQIVSDSSMDMPKSWLESQHDFSMVSLSCTQDGRDFVPELTDEAIKKIYADLRAGVVLKTAQANMVTWYALLRPLVQRGEDVLTIAFSSGLSGTCASALDAAAELRREFPERKIIVVDSLCASAGQGLMVQYALDNREKGMDIEQNARWVREHVQHLIHWFTVDDLMFLHRGGRLDAASAVLGSIVRVKPIMRMDEAGKLAVVEKVAGRRRSIHRLAEKVRESIVDPDGQWIFISHGDCEEEAKHLAELLKAELPGIAGVFLTYVGPVIGSHSGPGTLAVFFLGNHR